MKREQKPHTNLLRERQKIQCLSGRRMSGVNVRYWLHQTWSPFDSYYVCLAHNTRWRSLVRIHCPATLSSSITSRSMSLDSQQLHQISRKTLRNLFIRMRFRCPSMTFGIAKLMRFSSSPSAESWNPFSRYIVGGHRKCNSVIRLLSRPLFIELQRMTIANGLNQFRENQSTSHHQNSSVVSVWQNFSIQGVTLSRKFKLQTEKGIPFRQLVQYLIIMRLGCDVELFNHQE